MNKRTNIMFVFKANEKEKKHSFVSQGGVDVGDVDANAKRLFVAMHCRIDYDSVSVSSTSLESKLLE